MIQVVVTIPDEFEESLNAWLDSPDNTRQLLRDGQLVTERIIADIPTALDMAARAKLAELARKSPSQSVRTKMAQIRTLQGEVEQEITPPTLVTDMQSAVQAAVDAGRAEL